MIAVIEEDGLVEAARRAASSSGAASPALAARLPAGRRRRARARVAARAPPRADRRRGAALGRARDRGVLLTIAGASVLRFTPPLVVTEAQIDEALAEVEAALAETPVQGEVVACVRAAGPPPPCALLGLQAS